MSVARLTKRGVKAKMQLLFGIWRSLVARLTGGQEVVGSNPAIPIETHKIGERVASTSHFFHPAMLSKMKSWRAFCIKDSLN